MSLINKDYQSPVILIPVYNPSENFLNFIKAVLERCRSLGLCLVLVNDGCDDGHSDVFKMIEGHDHLIYCAHAVNMGKGAALKTGLNEIMLRLPNAGGAVIADADGQHDLDDIINVLNKLEERPDRLVLGTRNFEKDIPFKSLVGNKLTRTVFYILTSLNISDTQTGLRGFSSKYFPEFLKIKSNGYAFEMEMLLWASQNKIKIEAVPIKTIYIDNNKGSHFKPFIDSIKIYAVLFRQLISSTITAMVDLLAFMAFFALSGGMLFWANVFSRSVAFPVYYLMNRDFVFKQKQLGFHPVPKLILLIIISGLCSYTLQYLAQQLFSLPEALSKVLIETLIFFVNFVLLRDFVYRKRSDQEPDHEL